MRRQLLNLDVAARSIAYCGLVLAAAIAAVCSGVNPIFAQQTKAGTATHPAKLLPATTAVYFHLKDPDALLQTYMDHPLHDRLKADPKTAKVYTSGPILQAKTGIAFVELMMGMSYYDMVRDLGGDGVTIAVDTASNGVAALIRSPDPAEQKKVFQRVIGAVKKQRRDSGDGKVESTEYRGIKVYGIDKIKIGVLDEWILVANNNELGKSILEASLQQPDKTLADAEWFHNSHANIDDGVVASVAIDLATIRSTGGLKKVLEGTRDNPLAELLLGGIFENLKHSDFVSGQLKLDDDSLNLSFRTPHDQSWIPEEREFYFGANGNGVAKAAINTDETVFNLSLYRDIAKMWLYGGDLFNQNVNDGMAEAESTLSTLFAGKDFVEEILGLIKPEVQLVVSRQSFAGRLPQPALKLPSFALVGELKEPKTMGDELRRTFQSAIGFFNVVGAMEGNPQMDQDIQMVGDAKVLTASFVPPPEEKDSTNSTIHYNFSPSLALSGDHFVLSSSLPLAKELANNVKSGSPADSESANIRMKLTAATLLSALKENREFLISNNMLENGNSRNEAETEIGLLFSIIGLFDGLSAKLLPTQDALTFNIDLNLAK